MKFFFPVKICVQNIDASNGTKLNQLNFFIVNPILTPKMLHFETKTIKNCNLNSKTYFNKIMLWIFSKINKFTQNNLKIVSFCFFNFKRSTSAAIVRLCIFLFGKV